MTIPNPYTDVEVRILAPPRDDEHRVELTVDHGQKFAGSAALAALAEA